MAETKHGTEVPGDAHGGHAVGFPPFQGETFASQLIWLAITFGALYALMAKVALPRLTAVLEARKARIDGDLATAAQLKKDTEAAIAAYDAALAKARSGAQAIAAETRDKLAAEGDAQRKALEEALAGKLRDAETTIEAAKAKAMGNVQAIAAEAASAIVEKLIGKAPADDAVRTAVDDAIGGRR